MRGRQVILVAVVIALGAAGALGVRSTRAGIMRTITTIHGTPVELLMPSTQGGGPSPGIVVVHGFAGSRQLMYGIAQSLARNGYAAAVIDLPGHGQNTARFSMRPGRAAGFDGQLTDVTAWLRVQPGVDGSRLALVGHSMGAGAVLRFASRDADMLATVAISGGLPPRGRQAADAPRNVLAMAGAWEFGNVRDACAGSVTASYPGVDPSAVSGEFALGTARRCLVVPGVEHIGMLFSKPAIIAMVRWFDQALEFARADRTVSAVVPFGPALLLHLAGIGLFLLVAGALFPVAVDRHRLTTEPGPTSAAPLAFGPFLILLALPPLISAVVMRFIPGGWLPLLTGDYLAVFFLLAAICLLGGLDAVRRPPSPLVPGVREGWRALALAGLALLAFAAAAQFAWLNLRLTGARWWLAGVLLALWLPYFLALEAWLRTRPARGHGLWVAASVVVYTLVLVGGVFMLGAPFFLLLLVPALIPMFLLHAIYSHHLRLRAAGVWPAALVGAVTFAWITAAVFPLT